MNAIQHAEDRRNIRKNFILALHLAIKRIRIQLRNRKPIADPDPVCSTQQNKLRWLLHRQRTQHHRIEQAEDRRVCPYSQRQRDQRHRRKHRAAQHSARTVVDVLRQAFKPLPSPCHVALLFDPRRVAESSLRGHACLTRRRSCLHLLLLSQLKMQTDLIFKVRIKLASTH